MCVSLKKKKQRQTDRLGRSSSSSSSSNCVRLRELKKASRFASWSQRRAAPLLGDGGWYIYVTTKLLLLLLLLLPSFFFLFSRSALTRTQDPQKQPSPLEKGSNSGGLSLPLCPSPARYPGNGSTSRTSFVESTRHSSIHSCLPSFYIWRRFFLFRSPPTRRRDTEDRRGEFRSFWFFPCQPVVSFAEIFSRLPLDYLGFLIIHRLSLFQSLKCTRDYLFHWQCSNAVLSITILFTNATPQSAW